MLKSSIIKSYLERKNSSIKTISFDTFDTLLFRTVPSKRVTDLAALKLYRLIHEKISDDISVETLITSRKDFQSKNEHKGAKAETTWTVSEWLNELADARSIPRSLLQEMGRKAELEAEATCLSLISEAKNAIAIARKYNMNLIVTSDMWLDQEWLRSLLEYFGLYFDIVFTSGTLKGSKRSGNIFRIIEKEMNLLPSNFLHVGDNLESDLFRPRRAGWHSIWTPKVHHTIPVWLPEPLKKGPLRFRPDQEILHALKAPLQSDTQDQFFNIGYNYLSPLLILFSIVQWKRFQEQGVDTVFYVARDGRLMFEVFTLISDCLPRNFNHAYIRLSRRSITLAHPDNLFQNAAFVSSKVGNKNMGEWISHFNIESNLKALILKKAGLNLTSNFKKPQRDEFRQACHFFLSEIQEAQKKQSTMIRDYLIQNAKGHSLKRVGVVDSGWACTTQDVIRNVLDKAEIVSGTYLGVGIHGKKPDSRNLKYGLLRDDFRRPNYHNPLEASAGVIRVWDTLLRELAGTVLELRREKNGQVKPILGPATLREYDCSAANSLLRGVCEGTLARRKGARLIAELSDQWSDADFEIASTRIARKITTTPSKKMAEGILQLCFDEGSTSGESASLGFRAIKNGVAWYTGITASMSLGAASYFLETGAKMALIYKRHKIKTKK